VGGDLVARAVRRGGAEVRELPKGEAPGRVAAE